MATTNLIIFPTAIYLAEIETARGFWAAVGKLVPNSRRLAVQEARQEILTHQDGNRILGSSVLGYKPWIVFSPTRSNSYYVPILSCSHHLSQSQMLRIWRAWQVRA